MEIPTQPSFVNRVLNATERYFKMDVRYLARGTIWGAVSQVATIAVSLALSIVMSRYVSKDVYGDYKYILSIVSLLPLLSLTGLGSAVLQSVSRGFDGALQQAFKTNLRWSFAVFIGAFALALYYFLQHNTALAFGVLLGGCISPIMTSASLTSSFLYAKKDFARLSIYSSILGSFVPTLALIITALFDPNAVALVVVYFVSNVLTDLYLYWYIMRIYKPDTTKRDPAMLSYAKHLSFMGIITGLAGSLDQILLFHFAGPVNLAVYAFATGIPDQIKGPFKNLDSMLQARFANHLPKDVHANMRSKFILLFVFTLATIVLYILCAPFLYHMLYPNYGDAIRYSQIYMLSFIGLIFAPAYSYLSAKKLVKEQYISNVFTSIFQIIFMIIGVIGWGLWGLVWSLVITRIVNGLLWYILYHFASVRDEKLVTNANL